MELPLLRCIWLMKHGSQINDLQVHQPLFAFIFVLWKKSTARRAAGYRLLSTIELVLAD
jgi:hypothetical protein